MTYLRFLIKNKQAKNFFYLSILSCLIACFLLYVSYLSNSIALASFSFLIIFDFFGLCNGILNSWAKVQFTKTSFTFGFKRFEVLMLFSSSILTILGSFFILKEGFEHLFGEIQVHIVIFSSILIPASIIVFVFHTFLILVVKNDSLDYLVNSSTSSWLQEHFFDLSERLCRIFPILSKLLLPRVHPILLLGFINFIIISCSSLLIQLGSSPMIDVYAAFFIAATTIGTMTPFAVFTGKILLQTTPGHLLTQLDKILREASTLDGVLEFRNEHFWTISFGILAGSLHVRIRRDADEQLVLAHVWHKLAGIVQHLTIHVFKDDWIRRTTHQLVFNKSNLNTFTTPTSSTSTSSFKISPNSKQSVKQNNTENDFVIINP